MWKTYEHSIEFKDNNNKIMKFYYEGITENPGNREMHYIFENWRRTPFTQQVKLLFQKNGYFIISEKSIYLKTFENEKDAKISEFLNVQERRNDQKKNEFVFGSCFIEKDLHLSTIEHLKELSNISFPISKNIGFLHELFDICHESISVQDFFLKIKEKLYFTPSDKLLNYFYYGFGDRCYACNLIEKNHRSTNCPNNVYLNIDKVTWNNLRYRRKIPLKFKDGKSFVYLNDYKENEHILKKYI